MVERYLAAADFFHRDVVTDGPGTDGLIAVSADQINIDGTVVGEHGRQTRIATRAVLFHKQGETPLCVVRDTRAALLPMLTASVSGYSRSQAALISR